MNRFGIRVELKHVPPLDPDFIPLMRFNRAFLEGAKKPVAIAVERADGQIAVRRTFIHGTPEQAEADLYYVERLIKTMLWMYGGYCVRITDQDLCTRLNRLYGAGGPQQFDAEFMRNVFEAPFTILYVDQVPEEKHCPKSMGGHLSGCRIGFDAGGSYEPE